MAARAQRREWEAEYVSEYCAATFGRVPVIYHCRLGTWPSPMTAPELSPEEQAMLRVRMRWADAVVFLADKILVVEGKLRASEFLKGLGELQVYTHLVRVTPEFEAYEKIPTVGRLVIPIEDPVVTLIARQQGIETAVYQPTFWDEYTQLLLTRQTRSIRPEEVKVLSEKR